MLFPVVLFRMVEWLLYQLLGNPCFRAARKMRNYGFHLLKSPSFKTTSSITHHEQQQQQQQQQHQTTQHGQQPQQQQDSLLPSYPSLSKKLDIILDQSYNTMVCDFNGTILRSQYFFPFFMLVAFEGGSLIRAFLLLLSYPFISFLDYGLQLRVMIFITFCGLKLKNMACVERTVLPKFYLEQLNYHVFQAMSRSKSKAVFTSVPRVMVEGFVKEYLKVDHVEGTELHTIGNYYSGLLSSNGFLLKHKSLEEYVSVNQSPDIVIGNSSYFDHLFMSFSKESYVVDLQEVGKNINTVTMPRDEYPKPLIFHDGRLAFLPTPSATLCMFMWLPLGILLAIFRLVVGIYLPFKLSTLLGQLSGIRLRTRGIFHDQNDVTSSCSNPIARGPRRKGVLYVCTHRTLLDPVMLGICLQKSLTAVTYSLSKTSEIIAPIKTVRLTRDRKTDGETMERLLGEGDLVVCPEGTTCREPYLLRFSSLFAELADEIVPVGLDTKVSMFYGTTASGLKCLDPIFFLMNPRPEYYLNVLGKVPQEMSCAGGRSCFEVANNLQTQLAHALGFECTTLTRKDKYLMLAGNEGKVNP